MHCNSLVYKNHNNYFTLKSKSIKMENKPCLFQRNGRLEKGVIKRVDFKSSKVVVSFYEGKCGRTLDLNDIIIEEETEKDSAMTGERAAGGQFLEKNYFFNKKIFVILIFMMLFVLTVYAIFNYYKVTFNLL